MIKGQSPFLVLPLSYNYFSRNFQTLNLFTIFAP